MERDPSLDRFDSLGVFADWKLPTDEEIRFVAEDIQFQVIILGVKKSDGTGWCPQLRTETIRERISACRQAGLEPIVMPWLVRKPSAIDALCDWLLDLTGPEVSDLFDAEEAVYSGTMTPLSMAERIEERLGGRIWGVTGIGALQGAVAPLAKRAQILCPQCYSFYKPGQKPHWSQNRATFPGPQQDLGYAQWQVLAPDCRFVMGQACYWGARPASGLTPYLSASTTMRFAAIEAASLGVTEAWYWSLKWLLAEGARGDEVRAFFGVSA